MADREQKLRELIEKIAEECNYNDAKIKIKPISSGGANYSSVLYNITVSSPDKNDLHLFAKVMNFSESARSALGATMIFDTESFIYKDLAVKFKKLEQKCGVPEEERYVFPKFYGYNPKTYEETIVLENLTVQGYEVYDRLKSVDWPYASKAIEALAKYHALAMAYEEQNPEEYNRLLKKYSEITESAFKMMSDRFKDFVQTALSVTREENKEKLQKFTDRESKSENIFLKYNKPRRKQVLIHGDFRPSNIMHKVNKDGTINLIPLDFQTIQSGSCVTDLLYFIFSGSDAQFREQYFQRLVDHYYNSLTAALRRLRLDPDKIYPRKDFDYELKEALPYGLIIGIFLLPVITVEAEDAPDLNNEDLFENLAKPKTSKHYPDRINGVIDDYVKWGIL